MCVCVCVCVCTTCVCVCVCVSVCVHYMCVCLCMCMYTTIRLGYSNHSVPKKCGPHNNIIIAVGHDLPLCVQTTGRGCSL